MDFVKWVFGVDATASDTSNDGVDYCSQEPTAENMLISYLIRSLMWTTKPHNAHKGIQADCGL